MTIFRKFACDRCGVTGETEHDDQPPKGWSDIAVEVAGGDLTFDLCPDCHVDLFVFLDDELVPPRKKAAA
jgi:hypothetical protein